MTKAKKRTYYTIGKDGSRGGIVVQSEVRMSGVGKIKIFNQRVLDEALRDADKELDKGAKMKKGNHIAA